MTEKTYKALTSCEDVEHMGKEMNINPPVKAFFTYPHLKNWLNKHKPKEANIIFNIINNPNRTGHFIAIKIIDDIVVINCNFPVIYYPLNEMFYNLGYYHIIYIMDGRQSKLSDTSCGYYSLLFLKTFDLKKLKNHSYFEYKKIIKDDGYKILDYYHFQPDFDIKKYIRFQKILLMINNRKNV